MLGKRFEFLATWTPGPNYQQAHDDGRMQYNDIILPPSMVLQKHLVRLIKGYHFYERMGHDAWSALVKDMPGRLSIEGKPSTYLSETIDWWISGRVAGDMNTFEHGDDESTTFHSGAWMHPDFAMASTIAHIEEHEREIRESMVAYVGGTA